MKVSRGPWRAAAAVAALLTAAWCVGAAWWVKSDYLARTNALIASERLQAETRARDLAGSIRRNLHFISGVPEVMAHTSEVRNALARLAHAPGLAAGTQAERSQRWSADPRLRELSSQLASTRNHLDVDILYVADAAGDVIAASDTTRAGPSIATQIGEREYFRAAREGRRSLQYAVGKATGIPGLFFASPVVIDGHFAGAVVVKVHMANLSFLLDQSDAFLSDANGIIIMAHDKRIEMMALPGAGIADVSAAAKEERYRRQNFAPLPLEPWPYPGAAPQPQGLITLAGSSIPSVLAVQRLDDYGLQINVNQSIPAIAAAKSDSIWFTVLLATLGGLLIWICSALTAYVLSLGKSRARLWRKAHFDVLTGLPNRELFRQQFAAAMAQARQTGRPMALMIGDVDRFKAVNDTHGHGIGDELLRSTGERLMGSVGTAGTVARLGGDEFAVLLPDIDDAADAVAIAQRIITAVGAPIALGGAALRPTMSLGIALYPEDSADAGGLMRKADDAMYVAKRQGGNQAARSTPAKAMRHAA